MDKFLELAKYFISYCHTQICFTEKPTISNWAPASSYFVLFLFVKSRLVNFVHNFSSYCSLCYVIRTRTLLPTQKLRGCSVRTSASTTEEYARLSSKVGLLISYVFRTDLKSPVPNSLFMALERRLCFETLFVCYAMCFYGQAICG